MTEEEFSQNENIERARNLYKQAKTYVEEWDIPFVQDALDFFSEKIAGNVPPSQEEKETWGLNGSPSTGSDQPEEESQPKTDQEYLAEISESTKATERMIFWGLLLLAFIIIFK